MIPFRHAPTRDANDADHLAIMLLIGAVLSFYRLSTIDESVRIVWMVMGVVCLISAPLLWMRVPLAKWGGVTASLLLGVSSIIRSIDSGFSLMTILLPVSTLVIAFWFFKIDYSHRFE